MKIGVVLHVCSPSARQLMGAKFLLDFVKIRCLEFTGNKSNKRSKDKIAALGAREMA